MRIDDPSLRIDHQFFDVIRAASLNLVRESIQHALAS
jgi:hypothetical protein